MNVLWWYIVVLSLDPSLGTSLKIKWNRLVIWQTSAPPTGSPKHELQCERCIDFKYEHNSRYEELDHISLKRNTPKCCNWWCIGTPYWHLPNPFPQHNERKITNVGICLCENIFVKRQRLVKKGQWRKQTKKTQNN